MTSKKEEKEKKPAFIKWFSELNKDSGPIAGGKGANLGEIYDLDIPVPPGFVVTAQAYDYFIKEADIDDKIKELLTGFDYEDTKQLQDKTKEVRKIIEGSKMPKEMEEDILEAYEHLGAADFDVAKGSALDILRNSAEPIFVAVRSSATTEDLAEASFAGQQDTYLNIKGNANLIHHIKKCFASLFTTRATYYRAKQGFKHEEAHLAVVIQKMVDSRKSGVMFSKDPAYDTDDIIIEAVWGLGEGIVSGAITPDKYVVSKALEITDKVIEDKKIAMTRDSSGNDTTIKLTEEKSKHQVLKNHEITKLAELALKLEDHFKKPQDSEFAIENDEIFIVQTRPITTIGKRVSKKDFKEINAEAILKGLAASPGVASGTVKIIEDLDDLPKIKTGDILVTKMTNPDMVVAMQKSSAIVTDEGGLTAHAAIVSREMGIPCVVGTREATIRLKEGEVITVDGYHGKIYKGKVAETETKTVEPVTVQTKTKIKVIVDLPSFAERASKTGLKKVGLTRMEGIIAESGKHPEYYLNKGDMKPYEDVIFKGIASIGEYFDEIWVRTSDIRSDEYSNLEGAPQEKEANPMLGFHGIRYSLKKPEILQAELRGLKRAADKGTKVGLILPQVILVEEIKEVKKHLREIGFKEAKVGIMIETPAAVQIIKDLCEEGIDFISFGTNDLTQYMLAIDRGNEKVQHLYDEMHPAILYQLAYVIRVCKRYNVETSICGQSGSRKEMVKYLVENGIDSISVNADVAKEISEYVAELEKTLIKGTDKEPRQYEINKEKAEIKTHGKSKTEEEKLAIFENEESKKIKEEAKKDTEKDIEEDLKAIEKEKEDYQEKKID